jgi:hypothetical protein
MRTEHEDKAERPTAATARAAALAAAFPSGDPTTPRTKGPGECPECGGLAATVTEIDVEARKAVLICQDCRHRWNTAWPMRS